MTMKKTLTVNLNNIVFHVDEDAYNMLHSYLEEISACFESDDERNEIMWDVESRISELLSERLYKDKHVINLKDVEEVIEIMGKPSQYVQVDEDSAEPKSAKKTTSAKRYYRDMDNAQLGGVAAGMAIYFGWDITLIRVLMVLMIIFGMGSIIPVYIVVWLIVPPATTPAQRLEMQGEDVTFENIKQELHNLKNHLKRDDFKKTASHTGGKLLDIFYPLVHISFWFLGIFSGLVGIVLIGGILAVVLALVFHPVLLNNYMPGIISTLSTNGNANEAVILAISIFFVLVCPIFMVMFHAFRFITGRRVKSKLVSWIAFIIWIVSIIVLSTLGVSSMLFVHSDSAAPYKLYWNTDESEMVEEKRNVEVCNAVVVSGNIELIIQPDSVKSVTVRTESDYLSHIVTEVKSGVLYISVDKFSFVKDVKVTVCSNTVNDISAKGACSIKTVSQMQVPAFSLMLEGASKANLDLSVAGELLIEAKGASDVKLSGLCNYLRCKSVGASNIDAEKMIAQFGNIRAVGASDVDVNCVQSIDADAVGASDITCENNPKSRKVHSQIGSSVRFK